MRIKMSLIKEDLPINFSEQTEAITNLHMFESKYKCQYGVLIERLLYKIERNGIKPEYLTNIVKLSNLFIKETFFSPIKKNPENWMNFFALFNIPLKMSNLTISNMKYVKRGIFQVDAWFQYYFLQEDMSQVGNALCNYLFQQGYQDFGRSAIPRQGNEESLKTGKMIGLKSDISYYFTTEEQLFFPFKYLAYYSMFLLWNKICDFYLTQKEKDYENIWYLRDRKLFSLFEPMVKNVFDISSESIPNKFIFKYKIDTLNRDVLNLLFNEYIFSKFLTIEKKASTYIFSRYSTINQKIK